MITGPVLEGERREAMAAGLEPATVIELRDVSVQYRTVHALSGVSLAIGKGEFFSLLGPSGCGKSTLLGVVGGFLQPSAGDVLIEGRSVLRLPPYRRPVNTVFQSYALFPHMTVAENVGFGPRMAGQRRDDVGRRVQEALQLVALGGYGKRRPSELSGGQQQRVALARALVNHPRVLLLDEPLGALDLKMRKQMQLELIRIHREIGITFVYVTHDQEEAMTMSDRIAVMDGGSIVQLGTPRAIYDNPESLFVADFIGASNVFAGELLERRGSTAIVRLEDGPVVTASAHRLPADARSVRVMVRPDQMGLTQGAKSPAEANTISGTVINLAYLGTHTQLSVRTGRGRELLVTSAAATPVPEPGAHVVVRWAADAAHCYDFSTPSKRRLE
ncbi:MAG: ABC transporter ATP-binding protein [Acetobacteraceae bacterium]|nr:ABC transporter ATP-binding protein [Acetobacteraceae bacterium]